MYGVLLPSFTSGEVEAITHVMQLNKSLLHMQQITRKITQPAIHGASPAVVKPDTTRTLVLQARALAIAHSYNITALSAQPSKWVWQ